MERDAHPFHRLNLLMKDDFLGRVGDLFLHFVNGSCPAYEHNVACNGTEMCQSAAPPVQTRTSVQAKKCFDQIIFARG
jgi:hypothetical protein